MARHKPLPHTAAAAPAPADPPPDPTIALTAPGQFQNLVNQSNTMVFMTGPNESLGMLGTDADDTITVQGTSDSVCVGLGNIPASTPGLLIDDMGQGTLLNLSLPNVLISVRDFQNDLTGSVVLNKTLTAPTLTPDGAGGTLLSTTGVGAHLVADFVADPTMALSGGPGAWKIT